MSQVDFKELLSQAVAVKASGSDKSGIVDVAIVTFACGFVLTAITGTCFGDKDKTLPPSNPK